MYNFIVISSVACILSISSSIVYADTFYSDYGEQNYHHITVSPGTHKFEVEDIDSFKNTEWYLTDSGGSPVETDNSGLLAIDPSYTQSFAPGDYVVRAEVYDSNWEWEEAHRWFVAVETPTGNLSVIVIKQDNTTVSGATVIRYTENWEYIDQKTSDSNGIALWSDINADTYNLEVYYNDEYWVNDTMTVSEDVLLSKYLKRNEPYAYNFNIFCDNSTVTSEDIAAGTLLTYKILVQNSSPVDRQVKVRLWIDNYQSSTSGYYQDYSKTIDSNGGDEIFAFDHTPIANGDYYRKIEVLTYVQDEYVLTDSWTSLYAFTVTPVFVDDVLPNIFTAWAPFPNPFNPNTTIRYEIPSECHLSLSIYDTIGRKIATLENGIGKVGIHNSVWNGKDDTGQTVASGIYLYHLRAGSNVFTGKLMLLK